MSEENIKGYTIPKPTLSPWTMALGAVVILALVGLGIVAFETFSLFHGPAVAVIFGLVIELGAATDAAGLAQGLHKKTWWIVPAIAITLVVSGWYNYAVVERAGLLLDPPLTDGWILHAVAWGPLASTFFMAIGLGIKVNELDGLVHKWERDRQAWLDGQIQAAENNQAQQSERVHELQARLELDKEQARLAAQKEVQLAQLAADEREKKRVTRLKARELAQATSVTTQQVHKGTYADFVAASEKRNGNGPYSVEEIQSVFRVSRKTAYNWINRRSVEPDSVSTETVTHG